MAPSLSEAHAIIDEALRARQVLMVVGTCRVDYEGRASSTLQEGERILIVKTDGSVLVHRPTGYEPVNWQPPKCLARAEMTDDGNGLRVTATREKPRESLRVTFTMVSALLAGSLRDEGEFALHVTEDQMRQAILTQPGLIEEGLRPLREEMSLGDSGFTDVVAEDLHGALVIIEIKRNPATREAVLQLKRYVETLKSRVNRRIRAIIAAPKLNSAARIAVERLNFEFKKLTPEDCAHALRRAKVARLQDFSHEARARN